MRAHLCTGLEADLDDTPGDCILYKLEVATSKSCYVRIPKLLPAFAQVSTHFTEKGDPLSV
ncbi:MAG TPA: hypothetical protein VEG65_05855 [Candidatus Bathyarchaeia archaeon]|nr:hypothetical protein [Candidatus Bathyarchaeia archaeon]